MKNLTLIFLLSISVSKSVLCQKVTDKELIGTWRILGAKFDNTWRFDGKKMIDSSKYGKPSPLPYFIDTSGKFTVLHFYRKVEEVEISKYYLIKLDNGNILKMQGGEKIKPQKWDINENETNTGAMKKIISH